MELVVGMGDYAVTNRENDILRTFSLASCVAVTAYSPLKRIAGMIHVVLPDPLSHMDGKERPSYFAKTGVPLMIGELFSKYGCRKEELQIQLFGGAESIMEQDVFNIGMKNIHAVKLALLNLGLNVFREDLRGCDSRTLTMDVRTGQIDVNRQPICR